MFQRYLLNTYLFSNGPPLPPPTYRSHVCWHVYGLLHRSDRNYNEAIKAYKQALRIDPENLNILRDLSLLQIQMRDLTGFAVTRHTLLELKPNLKFNWLAFGLSKHLTGDFRGAVAVIDAYLGTVTIGSPELERGFESSELALYRNMILSEIPDNYREALRDLSKCEKVVVDRTAWLMTRAKYELLLAKFKAAKETFALLFDRGMTEDYRVHSGYMAAILELDEEGCKAALSGRGMETVATIRQLDPSQKQLLLDEYRGNLSATYPRSPAVQRIQLTLLEGEELQSALDAYCRKRLSKGMPSLCSDVAELVTLERDGKLDAVIDPADMRPHPLYKMLVDLAEGYIDSLTSGSKFSPDDDKDEPPSTILWALYLRAGLHELAGEYSEGIALLDKCIEHTPTAVDVYELKARLLKAAGDMPSAVECVDAGRELDKQDRYINNQTTKYMLQAGMEETALKRIAMFTKHEGDPEQNLYDMQCSWYELELAECLAKKKKWGRSLKKFGKYCMSRMLLYLFYFVS
jgi:tetratricopeptide (TPR) repeat protein